MSRTLVRTTADATVLEAQELLARHGIHHLLVHDGGHVVGILSDRDLLRARSPFVGGLGEQSRDAATLARPVHQLISRRLVTVEGKATLRQAAERMLDAGISSVLVGHPTHPDGILTWRDLVRAAYLD